MVWRTYKIKTPVYWLLLLLPALYACGHYSFSGVSTNAQSITVSTFFNNAGAGPADLAQNLTIQLRDYYQRNSRLAVVNEGGELYVEGEIINYSVAPIAPTGNDRSAQTRLSIAVRIRFVNTLNESENFEETITQYADFDQGLSLSDVENAKVQEILDKIIFDIFQRTVANW
ncbi:hypothetical protein FHS56_001615 [Thermonema lapsum]|jgi:hypothetical protein|uniref:Lipopolysaccharide-assembly n=1 Tax=Thermonema lapsum TaxID=28195 RepID=A0A846MRW6_9BACT|nr:LptE family protein [Thermonema lapsum]NIK74102.1 hypothetical protein [Thermonema lapsum]